MENIRENVQREIIEKIKETLDREITIDITGDSLLKDDIGIDSLDMVLMIGNVEDIYGVVIDESTMSKLETVADVVDLVMEERR